MLLPGSRLRPDESKLARISPIDEKSKNRPPWRFEPLQQGAEIKIVAGARKHVSVVKVSVLSDLIPAEGRTIREEEIDDWIGRYRRYWADHLDALERHLESKHRGAK